MDNSERTQAIYAFLQAHFGSADQAGPYSEEVLHEFLELGPLHFFIPPSMGGCLDGVKSYLDIVEMTAYHSLPLGLTMGITGSLFLMPMVKHAAADLREKVIPDFLSGPALGGIMITEPTGGTDVFGLRTTISTVDGLTSLNGAKCWGGLTGKAEHWLVAARVKRGDRLTRSLKLLYVPLSSPGVAVTTAFDALGLQPIPYGETQFTDVMLPESHNLTPRGTSVLRVMYDTLFRSRLGIAAIASGLCQRLLDDVTRRTSERVVFGGPIARFDQVQFRLSTLRGLAKMNHSLRLFVGDWMHQHEDISGDYVLVNAIKVISSDSMAAAADSAVQLFASAAYKRDHVAGRAYVDSRPFQIFEGSNDVLHDNTFEVLASRYDAVSPAALEREMKTFGLELPGDLPGGTLDALAVDGACSQREQVHLGKIIEWIVVSGILEKVSDSPSPELDDARRVIQFHLAGLVAEWPYLH
jgi:alkylation response protein AidB-like acyl-CoA dehydrogenase